jgi:tRNA 2-thiouridine synthesizing protein A
MPPSAASHHAEKPPLLDLTGYRCPMPVIRMEAALRRLPPGAQLIVMADDPVAAIDIPHFCREAGHSAVRKPDATADGPAQAGPICVFIVTRGPNPA